MSRSVPPKKKPTKKTPLRKVPPKKKKQYTCIACGDTGLDSRGSPCYPCSVRKANKGLH